MKKITFSVLFILFGLNFCSAQYRIQFFAARKMYDTADTTHFMVQLPTFKNVNDFWDISFCQANDETGKIVRYVSSNEFADFSVAKSALPLYTKEFPNAFIISSKKLKNIRVVR